MQLAPTGNIFSLQLLANHERTPLPQTRREVGLFIRPSKSLLPFPQNKSLIQQQTGHGDISRAKEETWADVVTGPDHSLISTHGNDEMGNRSFFLPPQ